MEESLRTLLKTNGLQDDVIKHIESLTCTSLSLFAVWLTNADQIADRLMKDTAWSANHGVHARLAMAWGEAKAEHDRNTKRKSEGISPANVDEPLREDVQETMIASFRTTYGLKDMLAFLMAADSIFGRIRREFEAHTPSMMNIMKVRTQADTRGGGAKKHKVSETVTMVTDALEEDTPGAASLWNFTELFRVLVTAWAICGNFDAQWAPSGEAKHAVRYAHLSDVTEYLYEFLGKVADLKRTYTDYSIMLYLEAVEKKVRAKAISLARGQDKMPWGLALLRALIASASAWSSEERLLQERNQKKTPQSFQNQGNKGGGRQHTSTPGLLAITDGNQWRSFGKDKHKGQHTKGNGKDKSNPFLCKFFNGAGGCRSGASCRAKHACNATLQNGQLCMQKHPATDHSDQTHGQRKKP